MSGVMSDEVQPHAMHALHVLDLVFQIMQNYTHSDFLNSCTQLAADFLTLLSWTLTLLSWKFPGSFIRLVLKKYPGDLHRYSFGKGVIRY